ncbi:MAG: response regulator [Spirochaetales bacterium]|nr:response regulator [Spirochaetales bacterium]
MTKRVKKVRIFSALEVANICGVVNQTAINWIKNNHLKAFTTPGGQYRIYSEDLIEFLNSRGMRVPIELSEVVESLNNNKKVMIIDDDQDLNEMMKLIFVRKLENFDIIQAFDGFEAGKLLVSEKPDVIILDIDLPGVNGHLLCAKIKEDKDLNNPVVISISGLDDTFEEEKILSEGADAFFTKPLDFDKLISAMKDLMNARVL